MHAPSSAIYKLRRAFRLHRSLSVWLTAVDPSNRLSVVVLIVASLAVASLIDYVVVPWPFVVAPLYGVPVLIASVRLSPRAVTVTAAVAIALDIASSFVQRLLWLPASVDAFGLLLIASLAVLSARHRLASEEANRRLHTFMGFVAHELRTPLTTQWGYLQLLEAHSARTLPEAERAALSAIEDATRILRRLTDDLVDTAGMESGRLSIHRTFTDLAALTRDAVRDAQEMAGTHQLVLQGPAKLNGEWDRDRISQILRNLISNAIKYSPLGGEIRVVLASGADQALIDIADQGLGIPPERMGRLFQPYSRLHREQQIDGLGLGLYLCKAIVEAHDGCIWAESEPGVGSTFHVVLPLAAPESGRPVMLEKGSDPAAAHG